jgi:hypothetical protein
MQLGDWNSSGPLNGIYKDIRSLGLEQNVAEHDAFGFTVVPPDKVAPADFHRRLCEAVLAVHKRRTGHRIAFDELGTATLEDNRPQRIHLGILKEDPIFEEALKNPVVTALSRYFCGKSAMLSDISALIKRADDSPTQRLHVDQNSAPPPLPPHPQLLNVTWPLTDYTIENGPIAIVPSSHRFGRGPTPQEEEHINRDTPIQPIPVLCDAGSIVAFGGTTWHSAFPRTAPGLRITLVLMFCRPYMKQMHDFRADTPKEVFERNPDFAKLLGVNYLYPMNSAEKPSGEAGIGPDVSPEVLDAFWAGGRHFWG